MQGSCTVALTNGRPIATLTRGRPTVRTVENRSVFIEVLGKTASVTAASAAAGISRNSVYLWRDDDADFRAAWEEAQDRGTDALEDEAVRRALTISDSLLIFLLRCRRPERYRERTTLEHTGAGGGPLQIEDRRQPINVYIAEFSVTNVTNVLGPVSAPTLALEPSEDGTGVE